MTWTKNDQRRAMQRGWLIKQGAIWAWQDLGDITRMPRFPHGQAAATHVLNRAFRGDRLSRKAVRLVLIQGLDQQT